jgi:hypothetical protein
VPKQPSEEGARKGESLRSIVDQATGVQESEPEAPSEQRDWRHAARVIAGSGLLLAGLALMSYVIVRLIHIGTCASGNTPYVPAKQCPSGTGWLALWILLALVLALIGVAVAGLGLALPGGIAFTVVGAAALYGAATAPADSRGGALGGYIVGATFVVMGVSYLAFGIWMRGGNSKTGPSLSMEGLSTLIAATSPKPGAGVPTKEGETTDKGG